MNQRHRAVGYVFLTKNSAGQSILTPFANYKQVLATQAPPDVTSARRAQAALRISF